MHSWEYFVVLDNLSTPKPPEYVPPFTIFAPWCFRALQLPDDPYQRGRLYALRLLCLCTVRPHDSPIAKTHLVQFYKVRSKRHRTNAALKYVCLSERESRELLPHNFSTEYIWNTQWGFHISLPVAGAGCAVNIFCLFKTHQRTDFVRFWWDFCTYFSLFMDWKIVASLFLCALSIARVAIFMILVSVFLFATNGAKLPRQNSQEI